MALAAIDRRAGDEPLFNEAPASTELPAFEAALSRAVAIVLSGAEPDAATVIERALIAAPAGNAGWLLPVEPMLRVNAAPALWAPALARLRSRAA